MKVVCFIKCGELTIGKTYDVLSTGTDTTNSYRIINDHGYLFCYEKGLFKQLFEIRDEKIEKILE